MSEFSKEFTWGAATSAYQIEGGAFSDGKGASIWDAFCQQKGAIRDHSSGELPVITSHILKMMWR